MQKNVSCVFFFYDPSISFFFCSFYCFTMKTPLNLDIVMFNKDKHDHIFPFIRIHTYIHIYMCVYVYD